MFHLFCPPQLVHGREMSVVCCSQDTRILLRSMSLVCFPSTPQDLLAAFTGDLSALSEETILDEEPFVML